MRTSEYTEEKILLAVVSMGAGAFASLLGGIPILFEVGPIGLLVWPVIFVVASLLYGTIGIACTELLMVLQRTIHGTQDDVWAPGIQIRLSAAWPITHLPFLIYFLLDGLIVMWLSDKVERNSNVMERSKPKTI